jgi:hypothetical protein
MPPPARRVKSYSGETGIVYQYVFVGQRRARRGWWTAGTEYLFDVSADRKNNFPVPVFIGDAAVRSWQKAHGRPLSSTEQYAAAKMRLFRAFDQMERLEQKAGTIVVEPAGIEELLAALDIS